jgi:hypothetical protein
MLSRIEQILAQQIGSLSLANTKQTVTIEALQQQLVEREARIAELEAQLAGPAQPVEDDADYPNKRRLTKSH